MVDAMISELRSTPWAGQHYELIAPAYGSARRVTVGAVGRLVACRGRFWLVDFNGSLHSIRSYALALTDAPTTTRDGLRTFNSRSCVEGCGTRTVNADGTCDPCWAQR